MLTCPVSQFVLGIDTVNGGNTITLNGKQVCADTTNNLVVLGTNQQVWNFVPVNADNQNPY